VGRSNGLNPLKRGDKTMKLKAIGSNMTEIESNGNHILFSYSTPVAAQTCTGFYRTSKKWSVTTSKHINKWLDGAVATEKPQEYFDNLI
jgi:hypothetical protein